MTINQTDYSGYVSKRQRGSFSKMGSWPLVYKYIKGKKALDVGCSDGLYLQHLGGGSVGIEQVHELAEIARSMDLNVIGGDAITGLKSVDSGSFEAVLFSHVMEHLDCPIESLREINRVMQPGGILVLGLPTERNIYRAIFRHDYFDGTHLYAFTIRNAYRLLDLTGFTPQKTFYHLPKCRTRFGRWIQTAWNVIPFPGKEALSMAYWIIAIKQ